MDCHLYDVRRHADPTVYSWAKGSCGYIDWPADSAQRVCARQGCQHTFGDLYISYWAAQYGSLQCLAHVLQTRRAKVDTSENRFVISRAVACRLDPLPVLTWLQENNLFADKPEQTTESTSCISSLVEAVLTSKGAVQTRLQVLHWLKQKGCATPADLSYAAAKCGSVALLEWIQQRSTWNVNTVLSILRFRADADLQSTIDMLAYLHSTKSTDYSQYQVEDATHIWRIRAA